MTTDSSGGVIPTLSAEQLLAAIPGLTDTNITVDVVDFRRKPGASLEFSDIAALAAAIDDRLPEIDGVVITQGTDTIEETAYLPDLHYTASKPVVVTGAMRNPTMAGADGPANTLAAICTAAHPEYGFPGSERDLLSRGLIRAGYLDPLEARILLHALLGATNDRAAIATAFAVAGGYGDPETWPWPTGHGKDD